MVRDIKITREYWNMHTLTNNSIYLPTVCFNRCINDGLCFSNSVDSLPDDPLVVVLASSSDRSGSSISAFLLADLAAIDAA